MTDDMPDLLARLQASVDAARADTPRRGGSAVVSVIVATTDTGQTSEPVRALRVPADDAADLYVDDRYLGSLYDLGDLGGILDAFEADGSGEFDGAEFERRCRHLLRRPSSGSSSWPWATPDSCSTPWAYVWRANAVQVFRLGLLFATLYPSYRRPRARPARSSRFPTMREVNAE